MELPPSNVEEAEMRRLLVVDDEEIVLVALRETLLRAGYEVLATRDAAEALAALREKAFAVIITDQQMPRMTGLEFLAQAKVLRPDATRILITAVLNLGTVIEAINYGEIYRFIMKPWLRADFLSAVSSGVARYRLAAGTMRLRLRAEQEEQRLKTAAAAESQARHALEAERNRTRALAELLWARVDPALGKQAREVGELCRALGKTAGLEDAERRALEDAGWFHNIGCMDLPKELLQRRTENAGTLTDPERKAWEEHPRRSAEMAAKLGFGQDVQSAIETHRERVGGAGYPARLQGESIPRLGRLLAVAVAFCERDGDPQAALARLRAGAGSDFDPDAVACLGRSLSTDG